jgi:hypothetical protein
VPELDLGEAPPLFTDSLPVLRRIAFAVTDAWAKSSGRPSIPGWSLRSLEGQRSSPSSLLPRRRRRRRRPLTIVHTSGLDRRAEGRDPQRTER